MKYSGYNEKHLTKRWSQNTYDQWIGQGRKPMKFDLEKVIEECSMELGCTLSFLEYHCPNFFIDVIELESAIKFFSHAALFLDRSYEVSYALIFFSNKK